MHTNMVIIIIFLNSMTNVLNEINGRVTILFLFNLDKQWLNKIIQHTYVLPAWEIGLNL